MKGTDMQPIGPLMMEHRLIERMIGLLEPVPEYVQKSEDVHVTLLQSAVDFFQMYADRTHHGKEEDILFGALKKKELSRELKDVMNELISEHQTARKEILRLSEELCRWQAGDRTAANGIIKVLTKVTHLYPNHIYKEDKRFFIPVMEYFDKTEKEEMLERFWKFDQGMIHEKYKNMVDEFSKA